VLNNAEADSRRKAGSPPRTPIANLRWFELGCWNGGRPALPASCEEAARITPKIRELTTTALLLAHGAPLEVEVRTGGISFSLLVERNNRPAITSGLKTGTNHVHPNPAALPPPAYPLP